MSRAPDWSRRRFLRGIVRGVGTAIALPLLEAGARAQTINRLGYVYFPNGIPRGIWTPETAWFTDDLAALNEWMDPLEPFKREITIPTNIWTPKGNGHVKGPPTWLTGHDYDGRAINAGGISVDQIVAKHHAEQTLLPSLELSTKGEGYFSNSLPRNSISWSAPDRPMAREIEPRTVFDRLFSTSSSTLAERSIMDAVLDDARDLSRQIGQADRLRLEEYFESIRALERRIEFAERRSSAMLDDGAKTNTLATPTPGIPDDHETYVRLMLDLMVAAFQSDATRVATFMLDHGQSNRYFNFIPGVRGTWHALSHYKNASGMTEDDDGTTAWESVEEKRAMYAEVVRWHHTQMAYLLGRMHSIVEANGATLLDNSMLVMGSAIGDGNEHDASHLPILIAGRGAGTLAPGRQIENEEPTDFARIHLALMQRMGVPIERFGDATEPLESLG